MTQPPHRRLLAGMGDDYAIQSAFGIGMTMEVERGSLEGVQHFVEDGASVNGTCNIQPHPLEMAANRGHTDIIKYLVEMGADLEIASHGVPHEEASKYFILSPESGMKFAPPGSRPLHGACYGGLPDACHLLLQLGADPNSTDVEGSTPLMIACNWATQENCLALAKLLVRAGANLALQNGQGLSALHVAAALSKTDVARMLLSATPDTLNLIDKYGKTALAHAASNGQGHTLSFLLSAGANEEEAWRRGMVTALVTAIHAGQESMVSTLLEEGLEAVGGEGATPEAMRFAVEDEQIGILQMLLDVQGEEHRVTWANHAVWSGPKTFRFAPYLPRGIELMVLAVHSGKTMIHCAAEVCSLRSVHVLLSAGADESAADQKGMRAKDSIGMLLSEDKRDPQIMAAVDRMLARGPAFRACSWAWPSAAASIRSKAPRLGVRVFRPRTSKGFSRAFTRSATMGC